jgi:outer membrane protease
MYRYSSKTINSYISKIPNNVGYFDMYKLSFTIENLYSKKSNKKGEIKINYYV